MIFTDKDFDLIVQAVECAALGCAPCQNSESQILYDRLFSRLKEFEEQELLGNTEELDN